MAEESQGSQFWMNFGSLKRKKKNADSLWSKFQTPYDFQQQLAPSSSECHPNPKILISPPLESCQNQSYPLVEEEDSSPTRGRRRKRREQNKSVPPRRSFSCPRKKKDPDLSFTPSTSTNIKHGKEFHSIPLAPNDPLVSYSSDEKEKKDSLIIRDRKNPWTTLFLNTVLNSPAKSCGRESCGGSSKDLDSLETLGMSWSSEELETVRDRWLQELDYYRVDSSTSKSQDSINARSKDLVMVRTPSVVSIWSQSSLFSNLRRTLGTFQRTSPEAKETLKVYNEADQAVLDPFIEKDGENKCVHLFERNNQNNETQKREKQNTVVSEPGQNSHIIVRPGIRLPRSRSCESTLRHRIVPLENDCQLLSLASKSRAKSLGADTKQTTSSMTYQDSGRRSPHKMSLDFVAIEGLNTAAKSLEAIPQVPELKFNKYNFRRRRPNRLTLPKEPLTPSKMNLEITQMRQERHSLEDQIDMEVGSGNVQKQSDKEKDTTAGKPSKKCSILSALSKRSKSVDRFLRSRSPKHTTNKHNNHFRHSAEPSLCLYLKDTTVVAEEESGRYRGVIFDGTSSARTGTFPPTLVHRRDIQVGGMSGRGKPVSAVKVCPPTVPDAALSHRHSGSSFSSGVYSAGGDQRSSYSSSVSDDNPPPSPRSPARVNCDHGQLGRVGANNANNNNNTNSNNNSNNAANNNSQHGNNSPSHFHNNQQFTFPSNHQGGVPQFAHLLCPKTSPGSPHHVPPDSTYNYLTYQQQTSLEDQGIDVQSPGRSSPGSGSGSSTTGSTASSGGCRNSTTSLDSGRASTSTHTHQHRLSGQSYDSGSILRHSYHSSSSSLGSMEHDGTPHVNVPELLNNGVRDSEVLRAWLTDIRSEEYYDKFVLAGYDMPTISRMTPEDLNAIGITKPAHRKKLKAEITKLNISDRLPNFIPGRLEDWLSLLRLEEYTASLKQQGYTSVEQMTQLTWEDLEDIGITKLGHQKKVMLAIKRVKDIMSGKKFSNSQDTRPQNQYGTHEIMISRESGDGQYTSVPEFRTFAGPPGHHNPGDHNRLSGPTEPGHYGIPNHYAPGVQYGPMGPPQAHVQPMPHQPGPYISSGQFGGPQGPPPPGGKVHSGPPHPLPGPGQVQYRPDVVAVQVRPGGRGRSAESLDEPIYGTYQTFHPDSRLSLVQGPSSLGSLPPRPFPPPNMVASHPQRSMDDGDITPTNEFASSYEGGGTLPRPRTANKLRPVAKVTAKTRVDVHEVPQFIKDGMNLKKPQQVEEINMKELNVKTLNRQNSEKIYSSNQGSGSTNNTPQGTPKKLPPPPPRRSNSISETSKDAAMRESQPGYLRRGLSYGYMGIKNNLQPDVTPDLPPPPAPPDSANHQHLPDDFPPPPPPLTCVTMASASRITSTITTSSITSDSLSTSQTSTSISEGEASPAFRARRNDSNASFKSTSSTDSDSLPFANENAGTIKQRACRPHPGLSVLDTRNSPHSSPRSSPALRRKDGQVTLRQHPLANTDSNEAAGNADSGSPDGTGDVLNDIGNMLANLTDELDAMLEQELVLKN